ncbi:MAG TPA: nucleotide exchange factor GrpE [Phaeodactylibacter sp.]|nr:nucleotide exchange factor GrpE [Phaeodactylibacter sp.]
MMGKKGKSSVKDTVEELEENILNQQEESTENEAGNENTEDNIEDEVTTASELDEKDAQIAELKDKYLRLASDFENYKRRVVREKLEMMGSAAKDTLSALLPVLDDFDRAKKNADDENTKESFSEGVELVYHKLKNTLQQKGLKVMESNNEVFDPELHEAITEIPAPSEEMKGKVIDTVEKGYYLNDKILRHAKVVVGK